MLKKFYRGNNTITGVTFAKENFTFVVTQACGVGGRGGGNADCMMLLYCRESLL
jgi:hypothetical protein